MDSKWPTKPFIFETRHIVVNWLVGWLVFGLLVGWLVGWLVGYLGSPGSKSAGPSGRAV